MGSLFNNKGSKKTPGGTAPRGALTTLWLLAALLALLGGGEREGGGCGPPRTKTTPEAPGQDLVQNGQILAESVLSGSSPEAPEQDLVQNGQS